MALNGTAIGGSWTSRASQVFVCYLALGQESPVKPDACLEGLAGIFLSISASWPYPTARGIAGAPQPCAQPGGCDMIAAVGI